MLETPVIALLSALISIIALFLAFSIFNKVFQEDYKKPWLFISISIIFLALAKVGIFLKGFFGIVIYNDKISEFFILILEFISITVLTYAIFLEYMILKYYHGKFIKFKFVPVQEGSFGGTLNIDVSKGNSYFAYKKDKKFLLKQFSVATKSGFEGFLITEENPKSIRDSYLIEKTPIAWISQINPNISSDFLKNSLDSNSDIVDPININNVISFVDTFLEQANSPFIMIDLNLIFKFNAFQIVLEFLNYLIAKIEKFDGILICVLNNDKLSSSEIDTLRLIFKSLD